MSVVTQCLIPLVLATLSTPVLPEDSRSDPDHVDPWDVVTDYDFSNSEVAMQSNLDIIDKTLRLAQKDMKYFQEDKKSWEKYWDHKAADGHLTGFNFTEWNQTYVPAPEGFGDKETIKMMKNTLPEFDITKIKLKTDQNNNESVVFQVMMKPGPENKIIGYSSKRLHVQILAPNFKGAADNELARFLSKVLSLPRSVLKVKQGAGQHIRKVRIPKAAIQEKVYVRKLIEEFALEKVTETFFDA